MTLNKHITVLCVTSSLLAMAACNSSQNSDERKIGQDDSAQDGSVQSTAGPDSTTQASDNISSESASPEATTSDASVIRRADAHVHGGAKLAIVAEGSNLAIELETPLYNLIGFEHAPQTDAQRQAVETVQNMLRDPDNIIQLDPALGCVNTSEPMDIPLGMTDESHNHNHNHNHDHDAEPDADHAHKDIILSYEFECENLELLRDIDLRVFDNFENFTDIEGVFLGASTQSLFTASQTQTRVQVTDR